MARTPSSSALALRGAAALACLAAASAGRPAPHPAAAGLLGAAAAAEGAAGPEAAGWAAGRHQPCKRGPTTFPDGERVLTARAHETLDVTTLPESWFWGDVDGVNYLTESRNQHIPQYCGSCWAFGTTSSLSDRLKIRNGAKGPDTILSPQVLVNCGGGGSCEGGDPGGVYYYVEKHGLPDETCQNYEAVDGKCKPFGVCENCAPGTPPEPFLPGTCTAVADYTKYSVSEYGHVHGGADRDAAGNFLHNADKIKAHLYKDGPLSCGIHVTDKFEKYTGGIFSQSWVVPMPNHELALVGWGKDADSGEEYWIGRNSWGTYWGIQGFFKIKMHHSNLGVEWDCSFGIPAVVPTPAGAPAATAAPAGRPRFHDRANPGLRRAAAGAVSTHVVSPVPRYDPATTPDAWDIRDVNGTSFASINRNQHIPSYCGSCWTHGTMSALSDRIALARGSRFPEIDLAPQVLVNCVTGGESKGCSGGDPTAAYEWVFQNGVTDETCQNYLAKDHACDAEGICKDCKPASVFHSDKCMAREPLTKYGILEHGTVQGEENMMAEIASRGPIGCGLCVTDEFENYSGGIINDTSGCVEQDHEISIAGYGVAEDGTKYWIGRNSWGTYWGEDGWFRIVRGTDNLGVEDACDWAVPDPKSFAHPEDLRGL